MNPLPRLLAYARPYRGRFVAAVVAMVLYAAASAGITSLIKYMIDDVLTGKMTDAQARNVIKARNGQLKAAELQLQYARIFKGRAPDPMMPLLTPAPSESRLTPEEEAELRRLQEKSRG